MRAIRIVIADDSRTYRAILGRALRDAEGVEVVGEAGDGQEALELCGSLNPDLVLLDLEMPRMGGLEALERIGQEHPDVSVAIVSSSQQASDAMKALAAGALEIVRKPDGSDAQKGLLRSLGRVIKSVQRLVRDREGAAAPSPAPLATRTPVSSAPSAAQDVSGDISLVVIAVSTGGPKALPQVISKLPADFSVPVLVVQHLPPGFMEELAEKLDETSPLEVKVAYDGEPLPSRGVRFAQAGVHLEVRGSRGGKGYGLWQTDGPRVQGCRPAADVLFQSIAREYEGRVLSVVMTGMGCDGRDGVGAIGNDRSYTLAQDEASSTIYGMPRAVVEAGLADEVVPLDQLAARMQQLVSGVR